MDDVPPGFDWDPVKCELNLAKHGIDFVDAMLIFEDPHLDLPARETGGEKRRMAIGRMDRSIITVIYVERERNIRIISARHARASEQRDFLRLIHEG